MVKLFVMPYKNPERQADYLQQYRLKNKDKLKRQEEFYYRSHREQQALFGKEWVRNNNERIRQHRKIQTQIKRRARRAKFYKTNINCRLSAILRGRFRTAIKSINKTSSILELIGCSLEQIRQHLESKFYPNPDTGEIMTWENYGLGGWEIDHEIPCAAFELADPEQQRKCFHYTNLQPLWAKHNRQKGKKPNYQIGGYGNGGSANGSQSQSVGSQAGSNDLVSLQDDSGQGCLDRDAE